MTKARKRRTATVLKHCMSKCGRSGSPKQSRTVGNGDPLLPTVRWLTMSGAPVPLKSWWCPECLDCLEEVLVEIGAVVERPE